MTRDERISFHKLILWQEIKDKLEAMKKLNGQYLATDTEGTKKLTKFKMKTDKFIEDIENEMLHE